MPAIPDERFRPVRLESPLSSFLSKHDDGHGVFVSHLDQTSVATKKMAFYPILAVNLVYLAIFLWRATRIYANYGSPSKFYSSLSISGIIWLCVDLYILYITEKAVLKFAQNSLWYRLRYGFRPTEIVIRRPHPLYLPQFETMSLAEGSALFHDEILRALDPNLLAIRPGDALQTPGVWLVDYRACEEAYDLARLLGPGSIEEDAWRMSVWTRDTARFPACWMVLENWKVLDPARSLRQVELFKAKLESLGKGHLFEEWANLMYASSTTPSGASKPFNMNMMKDQVAFFKNEGIDFEFHITEASKQVDEEFAPSTMPIGF